MFLKGRSKHIKSCFLFIKRKTVSFLFLDDKKTQYQPCSHAIGCNGISRDANVSRPALHQTWAKYRWFDACFTTMSNVLSSRFNSHLHDVLWKQPPFFFFPPHFDAVVQHSQQIKKEGKKRWECMLCVCVCVCVRECVFICHVFTGRYFPDYAEWLHSYCLFVWFQLNLQKHFNPYLLYLNKRKRRQTVCSCRKLSWDLKLVNAVAKYIKIMTSR